MKQTGKMAYGCVVCAHLDWITQGGSCAVHLQYVHTAWLHVRILQRQSDHLPSHAAVNTMPLRTPLSASQMPRLATCNPSVTGIVFMLPHKGSRPVRLG